MIEYKLTGNPRVYTTKIGQGRVMNPCRCYYLWATKREREIIEDNAPFLIECHGTYTDCEASAAALAFNFTEK
jgi:hypothetical protein